MASSISITAGALSEALAAPAGVTDEQVQAILATYARSVGAVESETPRQRLRYAMRHLWRHVQREAERQLRREALEAAATQHDAANPPLEDW